MLFSGMSILYLMLLVSMPASGGTQDPSAQRVVSVNGERRDDAVCTQPKKLFGKAWEAVQTHLTTRKIVAVSAITGLLAGYTMRMRYLLRENAPRPEVTGEAGKTTPARETGENDRPEDISQSRYGQQNHPGVPTQNTSQPVLPSLSGLFGNIELGNDKTATGARSALEVGQPVLPVSPAAATVPESLADVSQGNSVRNITPEIDQKSKFGLLSMLNNAERWRSSRQGSSIRKKLERVALEKIGKVPSQPRREQVQEFVESTLRTLPKGSKFRGEPSSHNTYRFLRSINKRLRWYAGLVVVDGVSGAGTIEGFFDNGFGTGNYLVYFSENNCFRLIDEGTGSLFAIYQ